MNCQGDERHPNLARVPFCYRSMPEAGRILIRVIGVSNRKRATRHGNIFPANHQRPGVGQHVRADRSRLHDGIWRAQSDQFRAWRCADDRRHGRHIHFESGQRCGARFARHRQAADRHAPRLAPLITAIGVSILLQTFAMMIWVRNPLPFPQVMPSDSLQIFGALITPTQVMLLALALLSMIALALLVERTKLGRAMRATAENPRVAGLMGVDVNRVIVITFAIGAALAAVAGVMWGANYSSAHFAMGFVPGLKAFSAAVLGGIGNIYGAMLGGILLGLIESLGAGYIGDLTGGFLGSNYQDIFAFVVLIVVLTLRPSGIMGERVADRA